MIRHITSTMKMAGELVVYVQKLLALKATRVISRNMIVQLSDHLFKVVFYFGEFLMMRMQNIEFLRFLLAIVIVLFHCGRTTADGYLAVEMFFILAGYFLSRSINQNKEISVDKFITIKFMRLWPVFAVAVVLTGGNLYDMLFKLLFLHATGLTLQYKTFIWFVAPFFWVSVFYFIILKQHKLSQAYIFIALITYVSSVFIINYDNGNYNIRRTVDGIFSLAMLRAVSGIGLGILLVPLFAKIKMLLPEQNSLKSYVWFGTAESVALFFLIYNMVFHQLKYDNKLIFIVFFVLLLFFFIERRGFISDMFENKYLGSMGKYAYSIYIFQKIGFNISTRISNSLFPGHIAQLATTLTVVISLGVLSYHLIEKRAYQWAKHKIKQ